MEGSRASTSLALLGHSLITVGQTAWSAGDPQVAHRHPSFSSMHRRTFSNARPRDLFSELHQKPKPTRGSAADQGSAPHSRITRDRLAISSAGVRFERPLQGDPHQLASGPNAGLLEQVLQGGLYGA